MPDQLMAFRGATEFTPLHLHAWKWPYAAAELLRRPELMRDRIMNPMP
jgi:hypothetical protein